MPPCFLTARLGFALLAIAPQLAAQQPPQRWIGRPVRVTAPSAGLRGEEVTLVAMSSDTLRLQQLEVKAERGTAVIDTLRWAVPLSSVRSLEVQIIHKSHQVEWAALGMTLGGALGAIVGYSRGDDPPCSGWFCIRWMAGAKAAVGGVLGGTLGLVVGAVAAGSDTERWESVPLDQLGRLRVGMTRLPERRLGFGAALAF